MPIYEFEHAIRLTVTQRQALATAITDYHALTFNAPRYIVNCRFIDVSQGPLSNTFVGGQPSQINRLFVSLRSGTGRTHAQLQGLSDKLESIWDGVVGKGTREQQLRGIYIKGTLDVAKEGGFHLPMVSIGLSSNRTRLANDFLSPDTLSSGSRITRKNSRSWLRRVTLTSSSSSRKSELALSSSSDSQRISRRWL